MLVRRVLQALLALAVMWALLERQGRLVVSVQLERLEAQEIREQRALRALREQLEVWARQGVLARQVPPELLEQRVARVRLALREQLALPEMPEPLAASGPRGVQGQAEP